MEESLELARPQNLILEAFRTLSSREVLSLSGTLTEQAKIKGFTYQRGRGQIEVINLMLVPSFYTKEQISYLKALSLAVKRGVESVYRAWFSDPELARLLPFEEEEMEWIRALHKGPAPSGEPLWFRLDAHFHMKEKDWRDKIQIFELNSCAVGGIHYSPTAESLFLEVILPALKDHLPELPPFQRNPDQRELLLGLISLHARAIGRRTLNVAFAEDTTLEEGITEGPNIVEYLRRKGINAQLTDPRELYVKGAEVYYKDGPVDIVYRNFELKDVIGIEKEGFDMAGIKHAFSNRQVISSLCGEFDHKSMWDVLTSGMFDRYFTKQDAAIFKKHLLWTRVVREGATIGPGGGVVDLIPFALKNKDMLVLKPNRLCGGYGVTIGRNTEDGVWESLMKAAFKEEGGWVLQRYGEPEQYVFPLFEEGRLVFDRHNIVYGLSSTHEAAGILGRVSRQSVVNIAQHGGLMPVLRVGG